MSFHIAPTEGAVHLHEGITTEDWYASHHHTTTEDAR